MEIQTMETLVGRGRINGGLLDTKRFSNFLSANDLLIASLQAHNDKLDLRKNNRVHPDPDSCS